MKKMEISGEKIEKMLKKHYRKAERAVRPAPVALPVGESGAVVRFRPSGASRIASAAAFALCGLGIVSMVILFALSGNGFGSKLEPNPAGHQPNEPKTDSSDVRYAHLEWDRMKYGSDRGVEEFLAQLAEEYGDDTILNAECYNITNDLVREKTGVEIFEVDSMPDHYHRDFFGYYFQKDGKIFFSDNGISVVYVSVLPCDFDGDGNYELLFSHVIGSGISYASIGILYPESGEIKYLSYSYYNSRFIITPDEPFDGQNFTVWNSTFKDDLYYGVGRITAEDGQPKVEINENLEYVPPPNGSTNDPYLPDGVELNLSLGFVDEVISDSNVDREIWSLAHSRELLERFPDSAIAIIWLSSIEEQSPTVTPETPSNCYASFRILRILEAGADFSYSENDFLTRGISPDKWYFGEDSLWHVRHYDFSIPLAENCGFYIVFMNAADENGEYDLEPLTSNLNGRHSRLEWDLYTPDTVEREQECLTAYAEQIAQVMNSNLPWPDPSNPQAPQPNPETTKPQTTAPKPDTSKPFTPQPTTPEPTLPPDIAALPENVLEDLDAYIQKYLEQTLASACQYDHFKLIGHYGDCYVFLNAAGMRTQMEERIIVDGYRFSFYHGFDVLVHNNGEIYGLQRAFENGLLTHAQMGQINADYRAKVDGCMPSVWGIDMPSAELVNEIEQAWCDHRDSDTTVFWLSDLRYYGQYGSGAVIYGDDWQAEARTLRIADSAFELEKRGSLWYYQDGTLTELSAAYESGLLTADQIAEIAAYHANYPD